MSDHIDITATDSDGTILGTTTLELDSDALRDISATGATSPSTGRRGFLTGMFAGAGAAASVGAASAQSAPDDRLDVATAEQDSVVLRGDETKHQPAGGRPLNTTESVSLYVDPDDGDDANDGTKARPLKTLGEALDRVPIFLNHKFVIHLADGVYSESYPSMASAHFVGAEDHDEPFAIVGNPENPEDVVLDLNLALSVRGPELDNAVIRDLQLNGTLLNKDGSFKVSNVTFTGEYEQTLGSDGQGMSLHESSTTILKDCTFKPALGTAVHLRDMARVHMFNCNGRVSEYATVVSDGAVLTETGGNNVLGDRGFYDVTRGGQVISASGVPLHNRDRLVDNFDDGGSIESRRAPPVVGYNPEWRVKGGSPTLEDGYLRMPVGDETTQWLRTPYREIRETTGRWEMDFRFESVPSSGEFQLRFISGSNSDLAEFVADESAAELVTVNGGSYNTAIRSGWSPGDDRHTIVAERTTDIDGRGTDGYRLTVDGDEVGTHESSFVPTPNHIRLLNNSDSAVQIHYLRMQKESGL